MFDEASGALLGAIKKQVLPGGAVRGYQYGAETIGMSSRTIDIQFPEPFTYQSEVPEYTATVNWRAPELYFSSDYVVAIFEAMSLDVPQSHVQVYQWVGDHWVMQDLGSYDGYFYDHLLGWDQFQSQSLMSQVRADLIQNLKEDAPLAGAVASAFNDFLGDEAKLWYNVGDALAHGNIGAAAVAYIKGEIKVLEDVLEDLWNGLIQQLKDIKSLIDNIAGSGHDKWVDAQNQLGSKRQDYINGHPRKVHHITLQDQFFAIASVEEGNTAYLFRKDDVQPGVWHQGAYPVNIYSRHFDMASGDKFVAIHDNASDITYLFAWNEASHQWDRLVKRYPFIGKTREESQFTDQSFDDLLSAHKGQRSGMGAANNVIVVALTDVVGNHGDVWVLHHDENMKWTQHRSSFTNPVPNHDSDPLSVGKYEDARVQVAMGNSFAGIQVYSHLPVPAATLSDLPNQLLASTWTLIQHFLDDTNAKNASYMAHWPEAMNSVSVTHLHSGSGQMGLSANVSGNVFNKVGNAYNLLIGSSDGYAKDDGKNYSFRIDGDPAQSGSLNIKQFSSAYHTNAFAPDITSTTVEAHNHTKKIPKFYQYNPNTAGGQSVDKWSLVAPASNEE
ncbi:MAG: hypothetical protein AAF512_25990, partial [Pseudomonadota bacterium]